MTVISNALPQSLTAVLPSIHWSLAGESPPLYFQSLEDLQKLRQPSPAPQHELFRDVPGSIQSLFPADNKHENKELRHFGFISIALLLLGHDLTDECHDLITPLSWPEDTHFGYGPSLYSKVSPSVQAYASYVHSLVHRKEAFHTGEFGMVGFQNANYWSSAVARSAGMQSLPYTQFRQHVTSLAAEFSTSNSVQEWCQRIVTQEDEDFWDARDVHALCAKALREQGRDEALRTFAERVVQCEIRILLLQTLRRAGYEFDENLVPGKSPLSNHTDSYNGNSPPLQIVDTDAALSAARKLSSAHLGLFRSQGSVTLRQVIRNPSGTFSAAAGIACRLLESPACRCLTNAQSSSVCGNLENCLEISVGGSSEFISLSAPGGTLAVGDVLARRSQNGPAEDASSFVFQAVSVDDPAACFVDPLYGTKGETPTTVIQWSKGTIF